MTDSVRERLLSAIVAATNGKYASSIPEDERDLPVTVVQDGTDSASTSYDTTRLVMPVNVARAELAVAGASLDANRAQAHAAHAALITAMFADETFGGLARQIDYTGGGISMDGNFVFAEAAFQVTYQHVRGQPAALE